MSSRKLSMFTQEKRECFEVQRCSVLRPVISHQHICQSCRTRGQVLYLCGVMRLGNCSAPKVGFPKSRSYHKLWRVAQTDLAQRFESWTSRWKTAVHMVHSVHDSWTRTSFGIWSPVCFRTNSCKCTYQAAHRFCVFPRRLPSLNKPRQWFSAKEQAWPTSAMLHWGDNLAFVRNHMLHSQDTFPDLSRLIRH